MQTTDTTTFQNIDGIAIRLVESYLDKHHPGIFSSRDPETWDIGEHVTLHHVFRKAFAFCSAGEGKPSDVILLSAVLADMVGTKYVDRIEAIARSARLPDKLAWATANEKKRLQGSLMDHVRSINLMLDEHMA